MGNEISFCELRKKEVVNSADGSKLGHIVDMVICVETKAALGIVAPARKSGLFSKEQNVFIPLSCIERIGTDVILVNFQTSSGEKNKGGCDEKCILYN